MNKFNPKCITYKVDPNALKLGIPVEQLPRQEVKEYDSRSETMDDLNRYLRSTNRLLIDKTGNYRVQPNQPEVDPSTALRVKTHPRPTPKKPRLPVGARIIELETIDFLAVMWRRMIKISVAAKPGQKFYLVDKNTGRFMARYLYAAVGEYGYFN